jgi:DNA-binding NarL/FixJ family response regulator
MGEPLDSEKHSITVVIADDHRMVRRGLVAMLNDENDFQVLAEAETGGEAVNCAKVLKPDILVMDVNMPESGWTTARAIKTESPATRIVVFSFWNDPEIVEGFKSAGASAYIVKGGAGRALVSVLRTVCKDKEFRLLDTA